LSSLPDDRLWPEGADPHGAVEASAVLDWPAVPPPAPPAPPVALPVGPRLPAWLGDVWQAEDRSVPAAAEAPATSPLVVPDWLADVLRAEQSESRPPADPGLPDWLGDVQQAEESAAPANRNVEDLAANLLLTEPAGTAAPAAEQPRPAPPPAPAPLLVQPPRLGQPPQAGRSVGPVDVIFRQAMREIHRWVDEDANQPLVLRGNVDAMWRDARLQEVLQRYQSFGNELLTRLWQYLEFLAENRRRHEAARAGTAAPRPSSR
jgi:hypothetical protein